MSSTLLAELQTQPIRNGLAEEPFYEVVDGKRLELPPTSALATFIASQLSMWLGEFARTKSLGRAMTEMLFHLPSPLDRARRPDVAFVTYERWPRERGLPQTGDAWDIVPDLAVEVVSPTDRAEDLLEKVEEYFRAGARLVWVVFPRRRIVQVYSSFTKVHCLTATDELDGGSVLPAFRLSLDELFTE